jgi:GSH-dependent disulfide-bond oxidoreductase
VPAAIERYTNETKRLLGVLAKRLTGVPYVAGADYTIADMAIYPWLAQLIGYYRHPHLIEPHPELIDYMARIAERPAVKRGMLIPVKSA